MLNFCVKFVQVYFNTFIDYARNRKMFSHLMRENIYVKGNVLKQNTQLKNFNQCKGVNQKKSLKKETLGTRDLLYKFENAN